MSVRILLQTMETLAVSSFTCVPLFTYMLCPATAQVRSQAVVGDNLNYIPRSTLQVSYKPLPYPSALIPSYHIY